MNNRKVNIVLGLVATVAAIVSILVLFATAFGTSDSAGHASTLGSGFQVMFGQSGFDAVPLLIVAFVLQCVGAFFALVGAILPGKLGAIGLGVTAICLVAAGIMWFLSPSLFSGINKLSAEAESVVLGTGAILGATFSLLAAVISLYGAYRSFKA